MTWIVTLGIGLKVSLSSDVVKVIKLKEDRLPHCLSISSIITRLIELKRTE